MSWLFSQALVEEYLEDISLDGAPCALSSGTPTQLPSWCADRTMAACRLSRSGMMFKPLTDDRGKAVLTLFLEAFPVLTSPLPEKAQESTESSQACGDTWQESLVKYDPGTSSWKTHQCLWEEDLPESSVTLPRWGMMQNGVCWERITLPPLTSGTGCGLLVGTPTATMSERSEKFRSKTPSPAEFVKMWPTPRAQDSKHGAATEWELNTDHAGTKDSLRVQVVKRLWPTPSANEDAAGTPDGKMQQMLGNHPGIRGTTQKEWDGGTLNPNWVEWLMGWPIGWTPLNALEMAKCRSVPR